MSRGTRGRSARRVSMISGWLLVFLAGLAAGSLQVFPGTWFMAGWRAMRQVRADLPAQLGLRPSKYLRPAVYPGQGVVTNRDGHVAPGLTLLTGFFNGGNELRLVRPDGTIAHRWPVSYAEIFPDPTFIHPASLRPKSDWNVGIHGAVALPDGSVVFNFDSSGLVKLDRCGGVIWTLPRMTHHSVEQASDGGFWVGGRRVTEQPRRFPELGPVPYTYETLMKVSADGRVEQEIPVLETLIANGLNGIVFSGKLTNLPDSHVPHLNDIEELSPEMAGAFPQFAAGDLLVSVRGMNMIFVIDPATSTVKWHQIGQWLRQHDPDYQPDGSITVFNNSADEMRGRPVFGGSSILRVDPATGATTRLYEEPEQPLFTYVQGKHQLIDYEGEHILIAETHAGRVLEVDAAGEIVWEFVNRYGENEVAVVTQATRYTDDYFSVPDWDCGARGD